MGRGTPSAGAPRPGTCRPCRCKLAGRGRSWAHPSGSGWGCTRCAAWTTRSVRPRWTSGISAERRPNKRGVCLSQVPTASSTVAEVFEQNSTIQVTFLDKQHCWMLSCFSHFRGENRGESVCTHSHPSIHFLKRETVNPLYPTRWEKPNVFSELFKSQQCHPNTLNSQHQWCYCHFYRLHCSLFFFQLQNNRTQPQLFLWQETDPTWDEKKLPKMETEFHFETRLPQGLVASVFFFILHCAKCFPVGAVHQTAVFKIRNHCQTVSEVPWVGYAVTTENTSVCSATFAPPT